MDQDIIATHLKNLDLRLANVEQILPTLATQEAVENLDQRLANVEQILPTVATQETVENLDRRLARAEQVLPTLATSDGLDELRRHMGVLTESLRSDIHLIAAHVASARPNSNER